MLSFITILAASTIVSAFPAYLNPATEVVKRVDQQKYDGVAVTAWCHGSAPCGTRAYFRAGDGALTEHSPMDETNSGAAENRWIRGDVVGDALAGTAVASTNSIMLPHKVAQIRVFSFVGGGSQGVIGIQEYIKYYESGRQPNEPYKWISTPTGINATNLDAQRLAVMSWSEGGSPHCELYYVKGDVLYRRIIAGDRAMSQGTERIVTSGLPSGVNGLSVSVGPTGLYRRLFVEMGQGNVLEYHWKSEGNPDWVLSNSIVGHNNAFAGTFAALYVPGGVLNRLNRLYTLSATNLGMANIEEWWPLDDLTGWAKNSGIVGPQATNGSRAPVTAATQGDGKRIYILTRKHSNQINQVTWAVGGWRSDVAITCDTSFNNCA